MAQIPLPNERYDGSIVVASTWIRDDAEAVLAMLLLLEPAKPFYRVVDIRWDGKEWVRRSGTREFFNIVPAVEDYIQNGGDY